MKILELNDADKKEIIVQIVDRYQDQLIRQVSNLHGYFYMPMQERTLALARSLQAIPADNLAERWSLLTAFLTASPTILPETVRYANSLNHHFRLIADSVIEKYLVIADMELLKGEAADFRRILDYLDAIFNAALAMEVNRANQLATSETLREKICLCYRKLNQFSDLFKFATRYGIDNHSYVYYSEDKYIDAISNAALVLLKIEEGCNQVLESVSFGPNKEYEKEKFAMIILRLSEVCKADELTQREFFSKVRKVISGHASPNSFYTVLNSKFVSTEDKLKKLLGYMLASRRKHSSGSYDDPRKLVNASFYNYKAIVKTLITPTDDLVLSIIKYKVGRSKGSKKSMFTPAERQPKQKLAAAEALQEAVIFHLAQTGQAPRDAADPQALEKLAQHKVALEEGDLGKCYKKYLKLYPEMGTRNSFTAK